MKSNITPQNDRIKNTKKIENSLTYTRLCFKVRSTGNPIKELDNLKKPDKHNNTRPNYPFQIPVIKRNSRIKFSFKEAAYLFKISFQGAEKSMHLLWDILALGDV